MKNQRVIWISISIAVGAMFVGLWQLIADAKLVSPLFLPGPDRVLSVLVRGLEGGSLWTQLFTTIGRMVYGWAVASIIGVVLGALIGSSARARGLLEPTLEFLRPLPASAVIPLAIALLGLSDTMVIAVIGFGALWPPLLATVHGIAAVEPRLYEVANALGISRMGVIRKIALPSSMPDVLSGLRISLTVSLILSIVGEMLASREGLGNGILLAARSFRAADVFAGVILLSFVGYVSSMLLDMAEHRILRWMRP